MAQDHQLGSRRDAVRSVPISSASPRRSSRTSAGRPVRLRCSRAAVATSSRKCSFPAACMTGLWSTKPRGSGQCWRCSANTTAVASRWSTERPLGSGSSTRTRCLRSGTQRVGADPGRNKHKAEELTKRHFRDVVTMLDKLHRDGAFELLIVGGHQRGGAALRRLPHPRSAADPRRHLHGGRRCAHRFGDIKQQAARDTSTATSATRRSGWSPKRSRRRLRADGPSSVFNRCLWAGSVAAVDALLVQDGAVAAGVICDNDRWLALSGDTCPLCGQPVRRAPDIVDELVQVVIDRERVDQTRLRRHRPQAAPDSRVVAISASAQTVMPAVVGHFAPG